MLSWFGSGKSAEVRDFAEKLAQQVVKRYPPVLDNEPSKRPSVNRLTRIIEEACSKSVEFQQEMHLGWLGKARLGNHFRWALAEAGYTKEFVEFATEAIIVHISRPRAQSTETTTK
jgi:hypothetical protein